jgi:hypothetical protein
MKKALTFVVLIVTPSIVFAQGTVGFANQTGRVQRWTSAYDSTLVPVPKDGGYVELIATAKGNPLLHPLGVYEGSVGFLPGYSSLAGFLAANPGWAVAFGQYNPGPIGLGPGVFANGNATIANINDGASADYMLIGWTGPYATYDAAYAGDLATPNSSFLGMSAIATTQTAKISVNPGVPVNLSGTFPGMTLAPAVIPESSTVLLAGLGAVLLLLFRRRG